MIEIPPDVQAEIDLYIAEWQLGVIQHILSLGEGGKEFNPDQPRDEQGQWTDGGGGSVDEYGRRDVAVVAGARIIAESNVSSEQERIGVAAVTQASGLLAKAGWQTGKTYQTADSTRPVVLGERVRLVNEPDSQFIGRVDGWNRVELNMAMVGQAEKDWADSAKDIAAGNTPVFQTTSLEETLVHEWGHNLEKGWSESERTEFATAFGEHLYTNQTVSLYAQENFSEAAAENFTSIVLGREFNPQDGPGLHGIVKADTVMRDLAAKNYARLLKES